MRPATALCLLAPLLFAAACASTAPPEGPSEAERQVAAARAEAEASAAAAAEEPRDGEEGQERRRDDSEPVREKIVVVDPGGKTSETSPRELAAAAREKRRQSGGKGVKRLTNENLAEMASRGKLTYADVPAVEQETAEEGEEAAEDVPSAEECDETCWRRRARALRQAWADTVASIPELEAEVADLRWQFYATDDPWERDSQIKPAWDRALDRLRRAREEAARYEERVNELMEEGRRAGALPGWLREGKELEPQGSAEGEARDPAEPVEPDLIERADESVEPKEGQQ